MRLIAKICLRFSTGRSAFAGWRKDGSCIARNLSREIIPGELFELPDIEARALLKNGSAIEAEEWRNE